jgi:purine-binding chemotaxis protein CheW
MNNLAEHFLSFRVGRQWYGVPIAVVIEVFHMVALSELPVSSPDVVGLMTVREMVIPVVDLRIRFGLANTTVHLNTPIITLSTARGPLGLIVDDADDVVIIPSDRIAPYDGRESAYITAIVKLPDKLMLILDSAQLRAETRVTGLLPALETITNGHHNEA